MKKSEKNQCRCGDIVVEIQTKRSFNPKAFETLQNYAILSALACNRAEIKPFNEFKERSISDRLQMIETLNQVVSADKGLMLDHTKEAAKKLQQLIESL